MVNCWKLLLRLSLILESLGIWGCMALVFGDGAVGGRRKKSEVFSQRMLYPAILIDIFDHMSESIDTMGSYSLSLLANKIS